jgi:hypothetical protein
MGEEPGPDDPIASLPLIDAPVRSQVIIPQRIDNLRDRMVGSYQFDLTFDPRVIEPRQIAADVSGTVSDGLSVAFNSPEPGRLKVAVYGAVPVGGDGIYIDLKFNVIGPVRSRSAIRLEQFGIDDGSFAVNVVNGSITVKRTRSSIVSDPSSISD